MQILKNISDFVSKYMAIIVVLTTAFALMSPNSFTWIAPHISLMLGIIMFGMGMTLSSEDFRRILKRPKDVFIGIIAQFTIMPLLAYLLAHGFNLPPDIAVGVILVGTCPGGTASNVMTYLAKGDVALSVSITMTTTLLAPILTPFLTYMLAGEWIEVSFAAMMKSILQVVILPIAAGFAVNMLFKKYVEKIKELLPLISITVILMILGGVVGVSADRILETGLVIMAVVICHNLFGYALGFLLAKAVKMDMSKAKAVSIEVGMQNSGLATSLAIVHFGAAAAIPGAIFSVWHNISGSIAANYLSKKNANNNA